MKSKLRITEFKGESIKEVMDSVNKTLDADNIITVIEQECKIKVGIYEVPGFLLRVYHKEKIEEKNKKA